MKSLGAAGYNNAGTLYGGLGYLVTRDTNFKTFSTQGSYTWGSPKGYQVAKESAQVVGQAVVASAAGEALGVGFVAGKYLANEVPLFRSVFGNSARPILNEAVDLGAAEAVAANGGTAGGLNLFKFGSQQATNSTGWQVGDRFLYLPNQGAPKLNWAQNSGFLRAEMKLGKPIFDSYRNGAGQLIESRVWDPLKGKYVGEFLNAERYLLQSRSWIYDTSSGAWLPPGF